MKIGALLWGCRFRTSSHGNIQRQKAEGRSQKAEGGNAYDKSDLVSRLTIHDDLIRAGKTTLILVACFQRHFSIPGTRKDGGGSARDYPHAIVRDRLKPTQQID